MTDEPAYMKALRAQQAKQQTATPTAAKGSKPTIERTFNRVADPSGRRNTS